MTRINLMHPTVLTRRHLVAEYKEITQILHPLSRAIANGTVLDNIPANYTLNGGHVRFWYDKGLWIENRITLLKDEMCRRGVNVDLDLFATRIVRIRSTLSPTLMNDWQHTKKDMMVNAERVMQRIVEKPHLYDDSSVFVNGMQQMYNIEVGQLINTNGAAV